ncbi:MULTISPECIES: DUF2809 domain-containing protein [Bacillales]|uniref:ribosomal maturation YjgA family protein n=1 Tax=Bacillus sp. FJAT-26390 TaxID=1743142 RepID=UPI0009E19669|nr:MULTISPECIES: DUF2809 domain-containing protein [Bacillales]
MILGFSSRRYADMLPVFVAEHAGDALWASMIYFGIRLLWVRKSLLWAALVGILFCFGIEFSQLYQAEWIQAIRSTFLGALVLGSGFLTIDLVRYSVGVAVSLLLDRYFGRQGIRS